MCLIFLITILGGNILFHAHLYYVMKNAQESDKKVSKPLKTEFSQENS